MATIRSDEIQAQAITIEGASFYPRPDGKRTRYYIRQSNIPDMLRKHALEWWMGNTERDGIVDRLTTWVHANAQGDGVVPAGGILSELSEIKTGTLYGYRKRDKAADFGTNAHDWLKWRLTKSGPEPVLMPGVSEAIAPAERWLTDHAVEPVAVECVVYDDASNVAGRIDLAAMVDGVLCINDWKTGKVADAKSGELYLEVLLQNHLYRRGWSCQHGNGGRSRGGWVHKLPRDPGDQFTPYPIPWSADVMALYDALVVAWRAMRVAQGKFAGGYRD